MKKLNTYINEAWSGIKQHTNIENIKDWCEEMGVRNYTINSKGEIDVDGSVSLDGNNFKELPFKFGRVDGYFNIGECKNLISLKNCPNEVESFFACNRNPKLDSLEGCPKEVGKNFYCYSCKIKFTEEEVKSLCKVKGDVVV